MGIDELVIHSRKKMENKQEQLKLFSDSICKDKCPELPEELLGDYRSPCGYTDSVPRTWTKGEEAFVYNLKKQGWGIPDIAKSVGRTETSVSIKLKRIQKNPTENLYNRDHVKEKYLANKQFMDRIMANFGKDTLSLLDVYCGVESWWNNCYRAIDGKQLKVTTNDKDDTIIADYHMDAKRLCYKMAGDNKKFDVVDLDPFGSAFECLVPAFDIAKFGLIVTLGEMGHKRWKRMDMVRRAYGITKKEDFTTDRIIESITTMAASYRVNLIVDSVYDWNRISRVYFKIGEKAKCVEQWHGKFDK